MSTTPQGRTKRAGLRSSRMLVLFVVPALAFYLFSVLVPSIQGMGYAFTDWTGLSRDISFVGFDQFVKVFQDPASSGAVTRTVFLAIGITVIQNAIGLLLALGVFSRIKSRQALRVIFFAPAVIAPIATAYLWQYMFAPNGPLNSALEGAGLGNVKQEWLGDPDLVLWSIIIVVVWQFAGYSMVIFLAGLESIPNEMLEAAMLDGAGSVKRFWYVVRPMLAPSFTVAIMLSVIGGLKLFDQVYILTGGGPGNASQTMSTLIYKNAFQYADFAYSIAMAVVLTILVAILSGVQYFGLTRERR